MVDVRRVRRYLWICGLLCAALPASASGAVTIGSDLAATADRVGSCSPGPCTSAHRSLPPTSRASGGLLAPSDGVVVRWRIKVGNQAGPVALRITRPGNSETRTGVATGATRNPGPNQVSVFDARLPIGAGDALGIDHSEITSFASTAGAVGAFWDPPLANGGAESTGSLENLELLVNADIEPDADRDGYGDETQDQCPTDASTHGTCPITPPPDPPPDDPDPKSRSLRLFVGHHPQIKKRVKVRATGFADSPLQLWVSVVRGKADCPPGSSTQPPRAQRVLSGAVNGSFRIEKRLEMRSSGRQTFCAYLGVGASGYETASKTRRVRRPRLKARVARQTVSRALRRHEFAGRVVKKLKQRCRRSSRATFSCRFSSSFPGYRLTGRGTVRLNERLSYRFRVKVRGLRLALTDKNEGRFPG
jgi:hypothetical protein